MNILDILLVLWFAANINIRLLCYQASFSSYSCWYSMKGACGEQDSLDVARLTLIIDIVSRSIIYALICCTVLHTIGSLDHCCDHQGHQKTDDRYQRPHSRILLTAGSLTHRCTSLRVNGSSNIYIVV